MQIIGRIEPPRRAAPTPESPGVLVELRSDGWLEQEAFRLATLPAVGDTITLASRSWKRIDWPPQTVLRDLGDDGRSVPVVVIEVIEVPQMAA